MNRVRPSLARAVSAAVLVGMCGIAKAGPLEPPPGPAAPTMKTLSEVEARTPIHQSDLPLTISVNGSYYLAESVHASQNGVDMITVTANNVSIDLNGFTIDGTGPAAVAADCIQIEQEVRMFALSNGLIRGCGQNGVITNDPFGLTVNVDRVQANQNGQSGMSFGPGSFGVISRSVAKSNVSNGIRLWEGVITECAAFSNPGLGLWMNYGLIKGCMARGNGAPGVFSAGGTSVDNYFP